MTPKSPFQINAPFSPSGDQPQAIETLTQGLIDGTPHQFLLGVTGSGKTYTMANIIQNIGKPALIIAHNKTLGAQLCTEFREFFPNNSVEYFVSYYDYYQPEAYIPSRDVYIEKEAQVNDEIERLRHSATRALLSRKDVIIVASVSCIYGLGLPEHYLKGTLTLKAASDYPRTKLLLHLEKVQYERNDMELTRGKYRVKGDTIDIFPSWEENVIRLEFFGDELEAITTIHPVSAEPLGTLTEFTLFPATHYVVDDSLDRAVGDIKSELDERVKQLEQTGKPLEAHRLKQRTTYDMDMLLEMGYCKGIENYSRHIEGRIPSTPPGVLLDFFQNDFITFIDESHVTIPQIRGMYNGDQARKQNLVDYGFRLPSAKDNRPLTFDEFSSRVQQCVYVSATPGPYELEVCKKENSTSQPNLGNWEDYYMAEQVIRPTGLLDPEIEILPTTHQIDTLITEIQQRITQKERTLVTTLTKQMAEDLSAYLDEKDIKVGYIHSEIKALDRMDILHKLRTGEFDVLVGVNLLREGLDLPEVSLVAILDADKEGFLRNERSLIQTIGRAARNQNGKVILYADTITQSMQNAINETNRRRSLQQEYNKAHNITPKTIHKKLSLLRNPEDASASPLPKKSPSSFKNEKEVNTHITSLEKDMLQAAKELKFELAASLRDQIEELKGLL